MYFIITSRKKLIKEQKYFSKSKISWLIIVTIINVVLAC
jgi:hypothetical protein